MNYFSINRKLFSTIVATFAIGILFILWFNFARIHLDTDPSYFIVSVIFCALMTIEAALLITAIWRSVMFFRGDHRPSKYPLIIVAVAMIVSGAFMSIGTYMNPIEIEISATPCKSTNDSLLSIGVPECYGKVTNPGLWSSLAILTTGVVLIVVDNTIHSGESRMRGKFKRA